MQKLCQKRALEVNKRAKEDISKVDLAQEIEDPKPKPPPQVNFWIFSFGAGYIDSEKTNFYTLNLIWFYQFRILTL